MPKTEKPIPILTEKNKTRFWRKVDRKENDECWPWKGTIGSNGYGRVYIQNTEWLAHRISFYISGGKFSETHPYAIHSCDNRYCVNPNHLRAGSPKENTGDAIKRNRFPTGELHYGTKKPECVIRGERHYKTTLTEQDVVEIRSLASNCVSQRKIAKLFTITQASVSLIVIRKNWPSVS